MERFFFQNTTSPPYIDTFPNNGTKFFSLFEYKNSYSHLISPSIDLKNTTNPALSFLYHKTLITSPGDTGTLYIDVFSGTSWHNGIDSIAGITHSSPSSLWSRKEIILGNYMDSIIKVRFRAGQSHQSLKTYISIDDVSFFEKYPLDIELRKIISPSSSCNLTANESVQIDVYNLSSTTIPANSIAAELYVDNLLISSEIIGSSIQGNSSIVFTFNQKVNLSTYGQEYSLKTKVRHINDTNDFNNSIENYRVKNFTQTVGYMEDFESFSPAYYDTDGNEYQSGSDLLANGWIANPSSVEDLYFWKTMNPPRGILSPEQGATYSLHTGPYAHRTSNGNTFLYTETPGSTLPSSSAFLTFPCLDLRGQSNIYLDFWFHKYGADMGDLYISVIANGTLHNLDTIPGQSHGSSVSPWRLRTVDLSAFSGQDIQLQFEAYRTYPSYKCDIAIDDISIYNPLTVGLPTQDGITPSESKRLIVYPNPSNGNFTMRASKDLLNQEYFLFDMKGQLLLESTIRQQKTPLNLDRLEQGVYFIRLPQKGLTEKIIIY